MLRRHLVISSLAATATLLVAAPAYSAVAVGQKAPEFTAKDATGKTVSLADFKGKTVVLEWVNPGCPYVRKHYSSGNMQSTQKDATSKGVVWLAVNSTETGHGDYLSPAALQAWMGEQKAAATHTLMDESGSIGQQYAARTTPHMYIINPQGNLVYAGGIDSIASARAEDVKQATNYVKQGLGEALAGKPISNASTRPYGCSVKYKS
jgi:AhpC/TSA family